MSDEPYVPEEVEAIADIAVVPGAQGLNAWMSDSEIEGIRDYIIANAPGGLGPDSPIYLRGMFGVDVEGEVPGTRVHDKQESYSDVFMYGDLTGDDPERADRFRQALGHLLATSMTTNWKKKTPMRRQLEEISIERTGYETEVDRTLVDEYYDEGLVRLADRSGEVLRISGRYYVSEMDRLYVDIYDAENVYVTSLPWRRQLRRDLTGLDIAIRRYRPPVEVPPVIPPQSPTGVELFEEDPKRLYVSRRYTMRGRYYVRIEDEKEQISVLRWSPRLEDDLRARGFDIWEYYYD
jgi:hypothetical protein